MKLIRIVAITIILAIGGFVTYYSPLANANTTNRCGPPHRVSGQHSLVYVARHQTHADVGYLLSATLRCNGGKFFPQFLHFYLNNGDVTIPMIPGTRLWYRDPTVGEPLSQISR